ncbi:hypothetical protein RDV64_23205 (plasmid) [Acuticoccus sp. MNP-M23]|uniref:hypothetical protein n=1 Tax=Acuticoccus sp. MNP-M23 TaxID=3072793 RepID=UPI00281697A2|nr:hypothetical protein [Acuticoccus sp. MNP-M23]WMS45243.1 hypothetical protein RDV64_23205 [Acuticoccus sp. MNP-M23]
MRMQIFAAILTIAPLAAAAQHVGATPHQHSAHMNPDFVPPAASAPTEPGQGAFAALSEIVALLEADPRTDWGTVDITALRDHLIDMDRLVTDTVVRDEKLSDGLRSVVTGDEATRATLRRMIPAHAAQLAADPRWTVRAEAQGDDIALIVTAADAATIAQIQALGFYGLMASQDHHRTHHFAIATGQKVH